MATQRVCCDKTHLLYLDATLIIAVMGNGTSTANSSANRAEHSKRGREMNGFKIEKEKI